MSSDEVVKDGSADVSCDAGPIPYQSSFVQVMDDFESAIRPYMKIFGAMITDVTQLRALGECKQYFVLAFYHVAISTSTKLIYIHSGIHIPGFKGGRVQITKESSIYNRTRSNITPCLRRCPCFQYMRPQEHVSRSSRAWRSGIVWLGPVESTARNPRASLARLSRIRSKVLSMQTARLDY